MFYGLTHILTGNYHWIVTGLMFAIMWYIIMVTGVTAFTLYDIDLYDSFHMVLNIPRILEYIFDNSIIVILIVTGHEFMAWGWFMAFIANVSRRNRMEKFQKTLNNKNTCKN